MGEIAATGVRTARFLSDERIGRRRAMAQPDQWDESHEAKHGESATHSVILSPEEARQGVISGRIRLVLAVSLTLVVVAFAIVYAVQV
jgi:hypothetical protein